jgi:hypothetical protein
MGIKIFIFAVGPTPPTLQQLLVLALRAGGPIVARCLAKMRPRNIYSTEARCQSPRGGGGSLRHDMSRQSVRRIIYAEYLYCLWARCWPENADLYLVGGA